MNEYDPNYVYKRVNALVGTKAILLNEDNKILILQRSKKAGGEGKWSLPGGGVEFGENPSDAIIREVQEETGIMIIHTVPFTTRAYLENDNEFVIIIGYRGKLTSENVRLSWEHDRFMWVSKEKALKLDLTEDARFFIREYIL